MPRLPGRLACALALPLLLSACAGTGRGLEGETHELKTLSDQTAAEKRAEIRLQLAVG
jgi:type IV pilus assembly protein PilF